jgi:hypothetical protein
MNQRKWILAVLAWLMIGSAAVMLVRLKSNQTLGQPGVRTMPLAGSQNLDVILP